MKRIAIYFLLISVFQQMALSQVKPHEEVVDKFYSWYVNKGYLEMKPKFMDKRGMTDLDFNKYESVHKGFKFSGQLITRSWKMYDKCRANLSSIPYEEFKSYQNLEQFEQIECSFQFWQWFGPGMDPFADYTITDSKKINDNKYEITVGLAYLKGAELSRYIPIIVERNDDDWFISEIDINWE